MKQTASTSKKRMSVQKAGAKHPVRGRTPKVRQSPGDGRDARPLRKQPTKSRTVTAAKTAPKKLVKPGATASGLPVSLLRTCRELLQTKYDELSAMSCRSEEVMPEVGDDIDLARTTLDQEISHELTDTQRVIMDAITVALSKLDRGDFGICEACGKPIPPKRLKALPWARCCIACQSSAERS
jgi:RNA polymerase-binding protein DksA